MGLNGHMSPDCHNFDIHTDLNCGWTFSYYANTRVCDKIQVLSDDYRALRQCAQKKDIALIYIFLEEIRTKIGFI